VERIKQAAGLDQDVTLNLAAYILQVNGAKAGEQALTATTAVEIRSIAPGAKSDRP
jgi:hypothetical protein